LVLQARIAVRHVLVRLLDAAAGLVVEPAVIVAPEAALLDIAVAHVGPAVTAMLVDESVRAAQILVEDEILAHPPPRPGRLVNGCAGAGDRPPIAAKELSHPRVCPGGAQRVPPAAAHVLAVVRHVSAPS